MRQDVLTSRMVRGAARGDCLRGDAIAHVLGLVACLIAGTAGCQTTQPVGGGVLPTNLSRGLSSSYKPPTDSATQTDSSVTGETPSTSSTSAPIATSATARIRGQSPTQWNTSSPGTDAYRNPMAASNATNLNENSNSYGSPSSNNAGSGQYITSPLTVNSPAAGYVAPQQMGGGVVQPAQPSASYPQAPTSFGQAPGAFAPGAQPPNTVYQPPIGASVPGGSMQTPAGAPGYGGSGYNGGSYAPGGYGYAAPGAYPGASPSDYNSTIAPGVTQLPNTMQSTIAPGAFPGYDPSGVPYPDITAPGGNGYQPRQRISPIDVYVQEARTGRIILGGSVNSDLGVAGQLVIDERNFDIRNVPRSWNDVWSGRAFRGGGQNFRAEFMPGNQVQRYTVNWTERNLFGYLPYSLSVGGFYYTRQYRDWTEQRLGGRAALGYEVTKDLSISTELRLEDVNISDPRVSGVDELDSALGSNDVYTARFRVARDTRDSPFMSTEGALLELIFDQVFGEYDFSRGNVNYSRYFLMRERADGGGRHTLASTWKFGVTGSQTPLFENYFAGGYSTLRGFSFRGASPKVSDVQVGGEMMFLGSLEYVFPLTADEMLRGVAFVDYGTVESDLKINSENFRVAPGLGLRVSVPALGPAPLAFDFAYPINHADTDDRQVFSFFMGFTR